MVYRPEISRKDFFVRALRISFLITIAALFITSAPAISEAAKTGQLSDLQKATQYYNKGQYEKAIPLLQKYVEKKPDPKAFYMLGYSLYKLGRHEEARKYFKESFLVEPEYSPTPDLEKKLHKRLETARPGAGDIKQAVPEGELPPEAQGLDPSQYRVIDKSSRLKMPETTKSTDTYQTEPAKRPATAKKKKTTQAVAKKEAPKPVTESMPVADKPSVVTAPAPSPETAPTTAMENMPTPAPVPVPAPSVENMPAQTPAPMVENEPAPAPAARPAPRQAPSARPAPGPSGEETQFPEWLAPLIGGGAIFIVFGVVIVIFLLISVPLFIIAKKLGVQRPVLAFVPIVQNWTLTSAAGLSFIWGLLITIIPLLSLYPIMLVSERLGKGKILGLILALILGPLGLLVLALIGKAGGASSMAASAMPDLSGEPDLDLPDMDDMGFDMEDDAFATDEGFGSTEGVGEHTDDFGTAPDESDGANDFDMDLEPGEDDFDTSSGDSGADDNFGMDDMSLGGMQDDGGQDKEDDDGFGLDFDDKSF